MANLDLNGQNANLYDQNNPMSLKLTSEETRILRECNREGLYRRSIPLATLFGSGVYTAVKYGLLKGNPTYGAIPKVAFASFVGFVMGKFSYTYVCYERMLAVPNGTLRQRMKMLSSLEGNQRSMEPYVSQPSPDTHYSPNIAGSTDPSDGVMNATVDLDPYHPPSSFDGFIGNSENSALQVNTDQGSPENLPSQPNVSYDELRRQNREQYMRRNRYSLYPNAPIRPPEPSFRETHAPIGEQNKYGDVWG